MDKFVLLTHKDKRAYFEAAAANLNIMPQLVEKDFWVCWILKILFSLPEIGTHLPLKEEHLFQNVITLSNVFRKISIFR